MLKKRLKYLRAQGITGKRNSYSFGDDFFNQMEDQWIFCAALMDIYGVKEMQNRRQDDDVVETQTAYVDEERKQECHKYKWWHDEKNNGVTDDEMRDLQRRLETGEDSQEAIDEYMKRLDTENENTERELAEWRSRLDDYIMQRRKPVLPPSRSVLILLPLTLIEVLDYAANALKMHRTDVIRRSLVRDVNSLLREEVLRAQQLPEREDW
jgi:hypothetical protein